MQNRKVIVEFEAHGTAKQFDGIDVRFNIEKSMSSVMNKARIDICNLAREDIEYLTTYTSQFIAINERKRIRLFAGYEESGMSLLFDGDIVEAIPTVAPNIWLNCKALSGYYNNKESTSITLLGNIPVTNVTDTASNLLDLTLNYQATLTKKIQNFSFTGSKTKIIKEINELGGVMAYEDDGVLYVLDADKPRSDIGVRYISETSGMVGMPRPDPIGVELQMLLDNSIKVGQEIFLDSVKIPSANGSYYIYELNHAGHLRGNEFYTNIRARRLQNGTSQL